MSVKSPFTTKKERGGYSAIVYKDGDLYVAEDNVGTLIKENTDAAISIQKAIDDYAQDGKVIVIPNITLTSTLKVLKERSDLEILGTVTSQGITALELGGSSTQKANECKIKLGKLYGTDQTGIGIELKNISGGELIFGKLEQYNIGLYFNPTTGGIGANECSINGTSLSGHGAACVRFSASTTSMEGNHFECNIFNAPIGFDILEGGNSRYQTVIGVIHAGTEGANNDIMDRVGHQLFICDFVRRETCTIAKNSLLINVYGNEMKTSVLEMREGTIDVVNVGFVPHLFWDFNRDSTGDWTLNNCTLSTPSKSITRLSATGTGPWIRRNIELNGGDAQTVLIRCKYISGTVARGTIYWKTASHDYSGSYKTTFAIMHKSDLWNIIPIDMSNIVAGGSDWIDNTIIGFRIDPTDSGSNVVLDIDYIAIGSSGYGSMFCMDDALKTPASASAAGNKGDIRWDAGYIYICTATDTWKRAAVATW